MFYSRTIQRRVPTLSAKCSGSPIVGKSHAGIHPMAISHRRSMAELPGKRDPDNMGGPGGQESFPASSALRRYACFYIQVMLVVRLTASEP